MYTRVHRDSNVRFTCRVCKDLETLAESQATHTLHHRRLQLLEPLPHRTRRPCERWHRAAVALGEAASYRTLPVSLAQRFKEPGPRLYNSRIKCPIAFGSSTGDHAYASGVPASTTRATRPDNLQTYHNRIRSAVCTALFAGGGWRGGKPNRTCVKLGGRCLCTLL